MSQEQPKYTFLVEWFDAQASLTRRYHLYLYVEDNSVEMFDLKNKRTFLKRVPYPDIKLDSLIPGAQVLVFARQLHVVEFGDEFTKRNLSNKKTRSLLIVTAEAYEQVGRVIDASLKSGFVVNRIKMVNVTVSDVAQLYEGKVSQSDVRRLTGGNIVAIEIVGENAIEGGKRIADAFAGAVIAAGSDIAAQKEISFFLESSKLKSTAVFDKVTTAVIKPHAVTAKLTGKIIDAILEEGFEITALQTFQLSHQASADFLEVYKGVVPDYNHYVEELASGTAVAMEIRAEQKVVENFRELTGPVDPEVGRHIRPKALRARFGTDPVHNAVHCTDLPEDGVLESDFFFRILQA